MTGLVVAGMHRSGTSLVTRMLSAGGWHPGEELLTGEREEYFEDAAFVRIHRAWLDTCLPEGEGHRDWGVSSGGDPDPALLGDVAATVAAFHAEREQQRDRWVAKDPRASLFLDQWAAVESLRFILVYRSPWDVVDSGIRLGHPDFCAHPAIVRRAWLLHNQRLLTFAADHRDRCTVISSEALAADPAGGWALLSAAVGLEGSAPAGMVDDSKLRTRDRHHPIAALTRLLHPECAELLDVLDALADLPRPAGTVAVRHHHPVGGGELPEGVGVQVVIPCRDDGDFLDEAIASVEAACIGPTELTVVDDGSVDDETLRILDALRADGRHVVHTPALGLSAARNAGIAASRTLAVLPLDADNRVLPALLAALPLLEAGETDVVHGSWEEFGLRSGVVQPPEASWDTLLPANSIDTCALIRRSVLDELGGYDETVRYMEDWDLWLSALSNGVRFHRLADVTFRYLVRPGSLVAKAWEDDAGREATVRHVLGKHAAITGAQTARLVLELVRTHRDLDALYLASQDRAAEAARHVASADIDRAYAVQQWEAEKVSHAVGRQALLEVRAQLTELQGRCDALLEALATMQGERDGVADELAVARDEHAVLAGELDALRVERDEVATELAALRNRRSVRVIDTVTRRGPQKAH